MSADGIAFAGVALTLLLALLGFVWRAASTSTAHELRIASLEKSSNDIASDLRRQIKELESTIDKLREAVWGLTTRLRVSQARASQGQFDQGETDPPRE
jgi:uncharacterized coiled-coil protein SlyX